MNQYSFIVPGDPIGFIMNKSPWTKRGQEYNAYRDKVRIFAKQAGCPVPLMPTKERPYHVITTVIYQKKSRRTPDTENVQKCIVDALCYQGRMPGKRKGKHDDFWTSGEYSLPMFGDEAMVMVVVREVQCDESAT